MINELTLFCVFLALGLILVGIDDCIQLDEQATEERRESFRQEAYADMCRERTKKQNREKLWEEMQ